MHDSQKPSRPQLHQISSGNTLKSLSLRINTLGTLILRIRSSHHLRDRNSFRRLCLEPPGRLGGVLCEVSWTFFLPYSWKRQDFIFKPMNNVYPIQYNYNNCKMMKFDTLPLSIPLVCKLQRAESPSFLLVLFRTVVSNLAAHQELLGVLIKYISTHS